VNWHRSPASHPEVRDGSHGIPAPTARFQPGGFGSPGASSPGTFRPQGLITLPTAFSPPGLATEQVRRSALGILPSRPCSFQPTGRPFGASPLLSFRSPAQGRATATSEVCTAGKGNVKPPPKWRPRRTLPSWAFSPPGLSPSPTESGFPLLPLVPFRPEALPTVPLPGGASGVDIRRSWLASLEAAGPHGVLHLSDSCRLLKA